MTVAIALAQASPILGAGKPTIQGAFNRKPAPGPGYLAGTFPDGITSVLGTPETATIRVIYRPAAGAPGDGAVVAEVTSAADGTWRVDNLDPALRYDVICRKEGYNDLIWANVSPTPI